MNQYLMEITRMIDKLTVKSLHYEAEGVRVGKKNTSISLVDCFILKYFCEDQHTNQKIGIGELMLQMNLSRKSVSAAVLRLQTKGYIERRVDELDKRKFNILLTVEGERIGQGLKNKELDYLQFILRETTTNEQKAILKFLSRVNQVTVEKYEG